MYVEDTFDSKYQLLINGRENVGIKELKDPKAIIDYSVTWWCLWNFGRL